MGTPAWLLAVGLPAKGAPRRPAERAEIQIEPGIDFEATHILYHVTVRNRGGRAVRDVVITPVVAPGPFVLDEPPKKVPVLGPREYGTASFRIRARGPPEELEVAAKIAYPDPGTGEAREATASPVRVDLRPPRTRPVYVAPDVLQERASRSFGVQDAFTLPLDAEQAYPAVERALAAEGLEKIEESTYRSGDTFVGQASFHGLDRHRASYAVRAVASRRDGESTLKLLVFVQAEESLFGFYWRVRDAVHRALGLPPHQP